MTTATFALQRSRFGHHLLSAIATALPSALCARFGMPIAQPTASESAAREAQEVRSLAYAYSRTDPGFSADLYAAAARHEGLHSGN